MPRTERDIPIAYAAGGVVLLLIAIRVIPNRDRLDIRPSDPGLRILLRHRLIAHLRSDRIDIEPDLGHDHRDAAIYLAHFSSCSDVWAPVSE